MQKPAQKCYFFWVALLMVACLHATSLSAANAPRVSASKLLSDVSITNAVVYVPLGKTPSTIAFFTLSNNSNHPISILKVTSKAVKKIVLVPAISTATDAVNPWLVLAHQTLRLSPTAQHLQLTGLKNVLTTGDELQLELSLSNGKVLLVVARAKSAFDQIHGH